MLTADTALRPKTSSEALTEYLFIDASENRFEINQRAYNDPAAFEKERELIFHKCWLYLGHQSEIPNNKDFVTRHVGGYNLIFNRDKQGKVHAFYNYCSHRGPRLAVEERGNKNVFSCPYHGWVYGSDGELRSTGSTGGYCDTINKDGRFNLRKVPRLDHYRGLYFVNYNTNAVDLETYLADTKEILDLMVDQFEEGLEVLQGEQLMFNGGNWKLVTDNFVDTYHAPILHSSYFEYSIRRTGGIDVSGAMTAGLGAGLGNGHCYWENPLALGRPVAGWIPAFGEDSKPLIEAKRAELLEQFGEERGARIADVNRNMVVFPNLVVTDNVSLSLRTVYPDTVDTLRMNIWTLGGVGEPEQIRDVRVRSHLSFVGPAGFAHPDDFELFDRIKAGYYTTPDKWLDFSKGMATEEVPAGDRTRSSGAWLDESQERAWWSQWDRILGGAETLE
ncbi:MAG: aromatic ring-hydroxylating dioxygenase subunit alpha [Halieaceae bacterium]|nr:aromatic ring-hydroxylating dioxygenase subunit alpha [Halieaceae bacterium]